MRIEAAGMPAGKVIDAKFKGHCPACQTRIEPGSRIYYQFEGKLPMHIDCAYSVDLVDRMSDKASSRSMSTADIRAAWLRWSGSPAAGAAAAGEALHREIQEVSSPWGGTVSGRFKTEGESDWSDIPLPLPPPAPAPPKPEFTDEQLAQTFKRISEGVVKKYAHAEWNPSERVFISDNGTAISPEAFTMSLANLELTCWQLGELAAEQSPRVLFWGPPGTGKTHFGYHTALAGREVFACTLTRYDSASMLKGWFDASPAGLRWTDGPGVQAWLSPTGARLVINEIHKAGEDMIGFLHCLLDDPSITRITLPDGRTVRPNENFQVIATMNGDPQELLDPALLDRFPATVHIDRVHPEALALLPSDLQTVAEKSVLVDDPERQLSIRKWLEFDRLQKALGNLPAAQIVFGARAKELLDAIKLVR